MNDGRYLDTLGLWEAAAALPDQLTAALEAANAAFGGATLPSGNAVRAVAAFGEGTAGTACEAAAALAGPHLRVPFWVGDGATVPAFVDDRTLVFAVSCAEGTDARGAAHEALARGARVVAVGSDGTLAALAADAGLPWCPVSPERRPGARRARRRDGSGAGRAGRERPGARCHRLGRCGGGSPGAPS